MEVPSRKPNSDIEPAGLSSSLEPLEISIFIESVAFGGAGVGRLPDGRVCFVPLTLPGERAVVRVVREKKSFVEAELVRLAEASPARVPPRCGIFGKCGGCAYQHAAYCRQLEIKTDQVRDVLRRVGGIENPNLKSTLPSPEEWAYRNRISVHVEDGVVGFHSRKSHRLVPAASCPIATEPLNHQLAGLSKNPPRGRQRLTLRDNSDYRGFSQVNAGAAEVLAQVVSGMLPEHGGLLIDAYCGAGFFAKKMVRSFDKVIGIEWSAGAVRAAQEHASENETYLPGGVEIHLGQILESAAPQETALLVDPPAEGLSPEVIASIAQRPPTTLVYVSCDPATLSRDLKKLREWYAVDSVQPVDMFPQTAEIEVAAKLIHT